MNTGSNPTISTLGDTDNLKLLKDNEIVRYMQGGISDGQKQRYFSEIYRRYSSLIFAKCISMLKDEEDANDAVQGILLKIRLNIDSFKSTAKLSTWIYSISYNFCIDCIRRRKKQQNTISMEEVMPSAHKRYVDSEDEIPHVVLQEKRALMVKEALDLIPVSDKKALVLKYYHGLSIEDLAESLGISESALKMKIMRAKEKLHEKGKEKYKQEWFDPLPSEEDEEIDLAEWENLGPKYTKEIAHAVSA